MRRSASTSPGFDDDGVADDIDLGVWTEKMIVDVNVVDVGSGGGDDERRRRRG